MVESPQTIVKIFKIPSHMWPWPFYGLTATGDLIYLRISDMDINDVLSTFDKCRLGDRTHPGAMVDGIIHHTQDITYIKGAPNGRRVRFVFAPDAEAIPIPEKYLEAVVLYELDSIS